MSLLELRGVRKSFKSNEVLKGINLDVSQHDIVCLIGASGSGKSTLLRCINGLESLDSGDIYLDNDLVSGRGVNLNQLRRRAGIVFQSYNLFPHLTVRRNIEIGPIYAGKVGRDEASERSARLLDQVGLGEKGDMYPDQLSGGQQQRVAIARALAMQPRLLLLDEITSALDPELVNEVLVMVRSLATSGMTMVLATHEMAFAREVATKVCFLENGVMLEEGTPAQIFSSPREERTRAFLRRIGG